MMEDLLTSYGPLPESLASTSTQNGDVSTFASCTSDSSGCNMDTSDCSTDGSSCTSDCDDCHDSVCPSDCSDSVTTDPGFSLSDISDTSVKISVEVSSDYGWYLVVVRREDSPDSYILNQWYQHTSDFTITIKGLDPETNYVVNVGCNNTGSGSATFAEAQYFTTLPSIPLGIWEWWSTIESGYPIRISADEWNAFCTFINDVRYQIGLFSYPFTTVNKGTKVSAAIINEARNAISDVGGHGALPNRVYSGDLIAASIFNGLSDAINAAI